MYNLGLVVYSFGYHYLLWSAIENQEPGSRSSTTSPQPTDPLSNSPGQPWIKIPGQPPGTENTSFTNRSITVIPSSSEKFLENVPIKLSPEYPQSKSSIDNPPPTEDRAMPPLLRRVSK